MSDESRTTDRTVNDVLRDLFVIHSGRTRYPGQKPRDDELLVAEIERLRTEVEALIHDNERLMQIANDEANRNA